MILYSCNDFAAGNIEGSEKSFTNISINKFPGENTSDIATTALRNIRVMRGEYAITQKLVRLFF